MNEQTGMGIKSKIYDDFIKRFSETHIMVDDELTHEDEVIEFKKLREEVEIKHKGKTLKRSTNMIFPHKSFYSIVKKTGRNKFQ